MKLIRRLPVRRSMRGAATLWVLGAFAAIALFLTLTEHRAHLYGALPFVLLALCPLLHMFHGDHGGDGNHRAPAPDETTAATPSAEKPPGSTGTPPAGHHHH